MSKAFLADVTVKRPAFVMSKCTIADCPIEALCVSRPEENEREVVCGYYKGVNTYGGGSQVVCGYAGR